MLEFIFGMMVGAPMGFMLTAILSASSNVDRQMELVALSMENAELKDRLKELGE
tara:strand:- start:1102 stop:1263 length:162 start_codon:yes stop_codon:yes gene_type:complete